MGKQNASGTMSEAFPSRSLSAEGIAELAQGGAFVVEGRVRVDGHRDLDVGVSDDLTTLATAGIRRQPYTTL
ncbi:hypothetical protein IMZ11_31955 [Microtetraspora sp. AC03309]|uniref:hypothetical protein n=1 Tax=Microtetraspora sp. AC03309 TaxID=2779376 RepID=UPI001E337DBD|nr:hypothetical protein [Microtetraspora sp. AC03309]MCC5580247.1 hypothetical protein [Microtetraspora sp. AC03309]